MRHNEIQKKLQEGGLADLASRAEQDHEVQMARSDLYKLAKYSIKLHEMLKMIPETRGLEGWQQAKITKAADYISSVYHNLDYEMKFEQQQVAEKKKSSYKDGLSAMLESKKKISEKSVSVAQQRLMGQAYAYKKGELKDASDAVKELANSMSLKDLKDFASTEHEGLPDKVGEGRGEGSGKNTQATRQTRTSELPDGLQKQIINLTKRGLSPADILKKFQMKYPDLKLAQVKSVAQNMEESTEKLCPDCGKPSYTTLDEEKQKGVDGKVCWKGYRRMGTKKKDGKTVDNCVKVG